MINKPNERPCGSSLGYLGMRGVCWGICWTMKAGMTEESEKGWL